MNSAQIHREHSSENSVGPVVRVVAVGDCNTLTTDLLQGTVADGLKSALHSLDQESILVNLSGGMRTTREGLAHLRKCNVPADLAIVNFGLVDSWETSIPSIYVPTFPESLPRKYLRKALKFVKRRLRHRMTRRIVSFGPVVSQREYADNIRLMVRLIRQRNQHAQIFLWGTVPVANHPERKQWLQTYNAILDRVASEESVEYVDPEVVLQELSLEERFVDGTHLSPGAALQIGKHIAGRYLFCRAAESIIVNRNQAVPLKTPRRSLSRESTRNVDSLE